MSRRGAGEIGRDDPHGGTGGAVTRGRPRLPAGRAVIGALLIVAAAASVVVAHRAATSPPQDRFLVATRTIPAGHTLTVDDLGSVAMDLPPGMSAVALQDADSIVGRVTRHQIGDTDLVRNSDLYEPDRFVQPGSVEVVVDLDPAGALQGALAVGQTVDVLSSSSDGSSTTTIVRGALVTGVGTEDSGIGATGRSAVRLSVPDGTTAELLVDAAVRSTVTLVLPSAQGLEP